MIDFILGFVVGSILAGLTYHKVRRMLEESGADVLIKQNALLIKRLAEVEIERNNLRLDLNANKLEKPDLNDWDRPPRERTSDKE